LTVVGLLTFTLILGEKECSGTP